MTNKIKTIRHETPEEITAIYFGGDKQATVCNDDGSRYEIPVTEVVKGIHQQGCWGFRDENTVHIWLSDKATLNQVIECVGHELGHMQEPYSVDTVKEEGKAQSYGIVAVKAYEIANKLMGER
jgi:uncharacterized protein YjaZ